MNPEDYILPDGTDLLKGTCSCSNVLAIGACIPPGQTYLLFFNLIGPKVVQPFDSRFDYIINWLLKVGLGWPGPWILLQTYIMGASNHR